MNQNNSVHVPDEFRNIPASVFVLNPGSQVMLGGIVVLNEIRRMKVRRKLTGAIAAIWAATWAFFHPEKCHRTIWREHWGRQWMLD